MYGHSIWERQLWGFKVEERLHQGIREQKFRIKLFYGTPGDSEGPILSLARSSVIIVTRLWFERH
jgi:hypothetical protein